MVVIMMRMITWSAPPSWWHWYLWWWDIVDDDVGDYDYNKIDDNDNDIKPDLAPLHDDNDVDDDDDDDDVKIMMAVIMMTWSCPPPWWHRQQRCEAGVGFHCFLPNGLPPPGIVLYLYLCLFSYLYLYATAFHQRFVQQLVGDDENDGDNMGVKRQFKCPYGSDSPGREFWPKCGPFLKKVEPSCDQTW